LLPQAPTTTSTCFPPHILHNPAYNILNLCLQVLDASPLLDAIACGRTRARFQLGSNQYYQPYLLVDGIYPDWACFIGPTSHPSTSAAKHFTNRQESQRKDVERAFNCLQQKYLFFAMFPFRLFTHCRFNILNRPSLTPDLQTMSKILQTCVILCVANHTSHVTRHSPQCVIACVLSA
jgi:hypothetical protein